VSTEKEGQGPIAVAPVADPCCRREVRVVGTCRTTEVHNYSGQPAESTWKLRQHWDHTVHICCMPVVPSRQAL
jgi:hypothetical protein